jgi:3-methyl-2-oxobutanoate hydroxymethyltransferase
LLLAVHLCLNARPALTPVIFAVYCHSLEAAEKLIDDAKALEEAGIVTLLIEAVPPEVGRIITEQANVPVIGIGAGPHCHGQLLISHDMLGCFEAFTPKFVKKYTDLGNAMREAFEAYINEVKEGKFPAEEHYYKMHPGEAEELLKKYGITD